MGRDSIYGIPIETKNTNWSLRRCAFPSCVGPMRRGVELLSWHVLPSSNRNPSLRNEWIESIRKARNDPEWIPSSDKESVCSRHFPLTDFKRKDAAFNYLKSNAVPVEFVTEDEEDNGSIHNDKSEDSMEFFGINQENYVVAGIHHHQDEDDEEDNNAMLVDPLSIDGESIITGDIEDEQADNEGNSTGNVFDSFHSYAKVPSSVVVEEGSDSPEGNCDWCGLEDGKWRRKKKENGTSAVVEDATDILNVFRRSEILCTTCHEKGKEAKRIEDLILEYKSKLDLITVEIGSRRAINEESDDISFEVVPTPRKKGKLSTPRTYSNRRNNLSEVAESQEIEPAHEEEIIPPDKLPLENRETRLAQFQNEKTTGYLCFPCNKIYSSRYKKFMHDEMIHLSKSGGEVPGNIFIYSKICGRSSLVPHELYTHDLNCHENYLTFFCRNCYPPKRFMNHNLLSAHEVIHQRPSSSSSSLDKKIYPCKMCKKGSVRFSKPEYLDYHLLRVHFFQLCSSKCAEWKSSEITPECLNGPKFNKHNSWLRCKYCGVHVKGSLLKAHQMEAHGKTEVTEDDEEDSEIVQIL